MPKSEREDSLVSAVVNSVQTGGFPESEDVASSEVTPAAFPAILRQLGEARQAIQTEVRQISEDLAPDIDSWIRQANRLQADIQKSKSDAYRIVQEAQKAKDLYAQEVDALKKAELLRTEVGFSERLEQTLQAVKEVAAALIRAQGKLNAGQIEGSLDELEILDASLENLAPLNHTNAVELLSQRSQRLRQNIEDNVRKLWSSLLAIEHTNSKMTIQESAHLQIGEVATSIDSVIALSARLDILESSIISLCRDIDATIVKPLLSSSRTAKSGAKIEVSGRQLSVKYGQPTPDTPGIINDITLLAKYFSGYLPASISGILADAVMPSLLARLISKWLTPAVPSSLEAIKEFQSLLELVQKFTDDLGDLGWSGGEDLQEWIQEAPQIWLSRRHEASLTVVRRVMAVKIHETHREVRVETQTIPTTVTDDRENVGNDDWDESWGEEPDSPDVVRSARQQPPADEDEEASAWEVGDQADSLQSDHTPIEERGTEPLSNGENEAEDWGWGGEDQSMPQTPATPAAHKNATKVNGSQAPETSEQQIILREEYAVTAIPDELYEMLLQLNQDARILSEPQYINSPITPSPSDLASLPSDILVGFRALAATHYQKLTAGNMFLYNDCTRLAERLRSHASSKDGEVDISVDDHVPALESFAKRAYGREMESQRTILRDLLDGAQGFANCTTAPFAAECANAISMTCDRMRGLHKEWKDILSKSALLQSLGSLLSTALDKIILDVEDMGDIGEEESKKLKEFCDEMMKLDDLFIQENEQGEKRDLTSVCTPNWIRFQYLGEILESSLADIRWLWKETDLRLDFEAREVIDLIEALFAESSHRREAIAEIKRS